MNVIGSRPDGWWRDRDAAIRRFVEDLQPYAASVPDEVVVVIDGRPLAGLEEEAHGHLELRYATRPGRDAADDRITELVADTEAGTDVEVVTADRELRDRVTALGATVVGPRTLRSRMARTADGD